MAVPHETLVIANPKAGKGRALSLLAEGLRRRGADIAVAETLAPGHACDLAADARSQGFKLVVAAGGDGTVHEVANGLLRAGISDEMPALGVIPLGSGCDYAKTFDIPEDIDSAVVAIVDDRAPKRVDAGEIVYRDEQGAEARRFFVNIAEVGIGGETVARAARLPRALGPAMYGVAFLWTLPLFRRHQARVSMDQATYEGPVTDLVVAIGRVFGGGMRVTPNADPADGLFDVQVHFGSKLDYVRGLPKVYKGTHIPHPRIREERAASVRIDCDQPARIEADGEMLGFTPATFRILPGALKLKV